ncbi:MAG: hypothetical protein Q9187_003123 [Circinaria calcarea]
MPPNRQPIRVDPRYPLPSPERTAQNAQRSPLMNDATAHPDEGLVRMTSRRRRISGQNFARSLEQSPPSDALPPAPDAPRVPPVSYRDAYGNGAPTSSASSKSFAARARTIPDSVDPRLANSIAANEMPVINSSKHSRRGSVNQSSNRPDRQAQQQSPSLPSSSRTDQSSPQATSSTTTPRQQRGSTRAPVLQTATVNDPPRSTDVNPLLARSVSRHVSAGAAESRSEWAADRSPLQKLEVKLNDISKEEKRARVQEAEQLLRVSKAAKADQKTNRETPSSKNTVSTNHYAGMANASLEQSGVRDTVNHLRSPRDQVAPQKVTPHTFPQGDVIGSERHNAGPNPSQELGNDRSPKISSRDQLQKQPQLDQLKSVQVNGIDRNEGRGVRFQNHESTENSAKAPAAVSAAPFDGAHDRSSIGENRVSLASPREHRRRAPQQQSSPINAHGLNGKTPRQVPIQQQQLYTNRVEPSSADDSAATYGGPPDLVPGDAVPSHEPALKYHVPPQPSSGIEARKRVGFGSEETSPMGAFPNHKHRHLSKILHHGRHHADGTSTPMPGRPGHLDEWKHGGVARLTLADTVPDVEGGTTNKAWWEGRPAGQQISGGAKLLEGNSRSRSEDLEDSNGMLNVLNPIIEESPSSTLGGLPGNSDSVRVRQYIGYDGTLRVRQRNRSWYRKPNFNITAGRFKALQNGTSAYSYDCSKLSEHDFSHNSHICQPYLSKELTKSMRAVRVRVPVAPTTFNPPLYLKCGPLLRYTGLRREQPERLSTHTEASHGGRETWRGSVMIVTVDAESSYDPVPSLRLFHQPISLLPPPPQQLDGEDGEDLPSEYVDPIAGLPKMTRTGKTVYVKPVEDLEEGVDVSRIENDDGLYEETRTANVPTSYGKADELLGRNPLPYPTKTRGTHRDFQQSGKYREVRGVRLHAERGVTFWRFNLEVELGKTQARIAYRINQAASIGFWVPAKGQTMNIMFHSCNGFSLSVNSADFSGPDPLWRDVLNNHQTKPFHVMIGGGDQIYNDAVMKQTTLFQEWLTIKNPHRKHEADFTPQMQEELETFYLERYSMWFSQGFFGMANSQIPMINLWDDHDIIDGFGSYPHHFMSTPVFCGLGNVAFKYYLLFQHQSVSDESSADEPSWLLGASPGPYINELSRSVYLSLGKHVAFLGLDCRTERMREEVLSEASYGLIFDRCRREIIEGETKHLIVLLGVPIAYPRLVWLENILTSRVMDPIKAIGRMGMLGNFLNQFDGGVEILDDLDDHWTARNHKDERNWFIQELQDLAADKSIRITILGGDVHLAAVGQFYSNPKLKIPKDRDHRYMPNVISSAIVNTPPPEVMGDILNKRNKTDEDMIPMFTHDVDGKKRNNKRLLPRRNWCSISEYHPGSTPPPTPPSSVSASGDSEISLPQRPRNRLQRTLSLTQGNSKPSNLFRRLSQRGPASPDQTHPDEDGHQSPPSYPHRTSVDGYFSPPKTTGTAAINGTSRNVSAPLPIRPISTFHRQPTNLAAAKGGLASQEINLENGLDIVINCEVSQRDPAGFTVPYRLLVPALWYADDAQENAGRRRKESWISKLTSRRGSVKRPAGRQGEGEWGGQSESETGTESESDRENMRYGPGKLSYRNQGSEATTGGNNTRPQISNPQAISPQSSTNLPPTIPTLQASEWAEDSALSGDK